MFFKEIHMGLGEYRLLLLLYNSHSAYKIEQILFLFHLKEIYDRPKLKLITAGRMAGHRFKARYKYPVFKIPANTNFISYHYGHGVMSNI